MHDDIIMHDFFFCKKAVNFWNAVECKKKE